jgi:hypothetical protein
MHNLRYRCEIDLVPQRGMYAFRSTRCSYMLVHLNLTTSRTLPCDGIEASDSIIDSWWLIVEKLQACLDLTLQHTFRKCYTTHFQLTNIKSGILTPSVRHQLTSLPLPSFPNIPLLLVQSTLYSFNSNNAAHHPPHPRDLPRGQRISSSLLPCRRAPGADWLPPLLRRHRVPGAVAGRHRVPAGR